VLVRFSRPYIWDYRVGQIKNPTLPIARAVAASSAFPPVLSPCEIEPGDFGMRFEPPGPGEDLATDAYRRKMVLSDGGVYDNLGLETAFKRYKTLLVSDGGGHIEGEPKPAEDWARHSYRVLNVIDSQVRALRVRQLIELLNRKVRTGSYWSIRQEITTFGGSARLPCPADKTAQLAAVATRLKKLDNATQDRLINWGYAVCDASIRCFHIPDLADPKGFPYPGSGV
jgi:NTE family protein